MKVVITSKSVINAKNGQKYFKYDGFSETGEPVTAFLNEEQETDLGIPKGAIVQPDQLKELFESLPVVDIQFNQRGRLQTIQV